MWIVIISDRKPKPKTGSVQNPECQNPEWYEIPKNWPALSIMLPDFSDKKLIYTSCYCEENIYHLYKELDDIKNKFDIYVPLWKQRASNYSDGMNNLANCKKLSQMFKNLLVKDETVQQTNGSNVNFNVKTHDLKACVIYPIKLRILEQCGVVEHIE
ncbi:hypothetical protein RhiirA5_371863 [Rhizophagus irregularis]|uniref:Uncharacterized protein n=1 Tax=Rhizophagus irregularis TaxID=588596 RepID=A0A2N0P7I1_9GLOM|nr:hypothetical protein RhiirA5_453124 [Rhizophagus irregularis]PKC13951.1 hypothetical protein RhiirA5_371863 [Rhizophagus irregularis]PKC71557.1 hypothetical protein RhiirA1_390459 [Rhizophagus irregularis]